MAGYAPLPRDFRSGSAFAHLALIIGFPLLTLWFKLAAPYDTYFFTSNRAQLLLHVAARIAFTGYLFGVFFGSGQWLLRGMTGHLPLFSLSACEEIAVSVLAGSALIRICMLILGFAKLYSFGLLMPLGVLALAGAGRLPKRLRLPQLPMEAPCVTRIARIALLATLAASIATVFIAKSLCPNATGDYFKHYFPYYMNAIKSAGIWPNDVWYHFYFSKGAGDVFLSMILSDPLAPLAVSFVMYLTGIAVGYAFLKRMTQDVLGSLVVSVMLAAVFICANQTHPQLGTWAEFSKQHITTAVLFWGIVWAGWLLQELPPEQRSAWRNTTAVIVIGLMVLRPQFAPLCGAYFILLAIVAAYRGSSLMRPYVALAMVAALSAAAMLAVNYAITGLADITPFPLFWGFADQERFSRWVSPFLMITGVLGSSQEIGAIATSDLGHYPRSYLLALIFRFNLVVPYAIPLLLSAILVVPATWHKSITLPPALLRGLVCLAAMLIAAVLLFFFSHQIYSVFRLYVFCTYPVLVITAIPFALVGRVSSGKPKREQAVAVAMAMIGLLAFGYAMHEVGNKAKRHWIQFALGTKNVAATYSDEFFLWKPGIAACAQVPPDTRIWSSQSTGELFESPHCRFETFFSYSMGRDFGTVVFDEADKAEAALRNQKLDYFLIDTTAPFFDILPYSPLFSPEQIGNHFGVVWSQGGVYLLTWRSPRTKPLPPEFSAGYIKSIASGQSWADFPALYQAVSGYYLDWKRDPRWPVAVSPIAPHPRGWQ